MGRRSSGHPETRESEIRNPKTEIDRSSRPKRLWLLAAQLLFSAYASLAGASEPQKLVALVDYIGGDYKNAVQGGKVVNPEEHKEMMEFSARALELLDQLKEGRGGHKREIETDLKLLALHIKNKESEKTVARLAQSIQKRLINDYGITPYPRSLPSLGAGRTVFVENCAQCHGETGKGDGPNRATLNPPNPSPTDFTDNNVMSGLSPFRIFNVASFGIEGTAMPDFSALSEQDRWAVAFYVDSLRFSAEQSREGKRALQTRAMLEELKSPATLASLSDEELARKLKEGFRDDRDAVKGLAYLRRGLLEESSSSDPLLTARLRLKEAADLYEKGEKEKAYQKAVESYLDGFELAEPQLFARDASFVRGLEAELGRFRMAIRAGDSSAEIQKLYREIDAGLVKSSELLSGEQGLDPTYAFLNAFAIIVREGLEAALVLAAILALLKVMGAKEAARYIHLGWVLAVVLGVLTWFVAQTTLSVSGSHRETMEGLTTLLAALVLFYMGYWLHTKAEAAKWQRFLRDKVQGALSSKRILTLVGVSFFAVYREAFEVVLFYQALWLQGPGSHHAVISGFAVGIASLCLVVFAVLRLGLKIPLKYFFGATGSLLYLLAFVFAGKGIKELQIAGWVSVTPLPFPPSVDWLGIYPTLETLLAQAVMVLALGGVLIWLSRRRLVLVEDPAQPDGGAKHWR